VESMAIALHHSRAKGTAKLILLGIANHDGDGGAWPSIGTLKRYAGGIDRRAIQRALTSLEDLGEIKRHIQAGGTAEMVNALRPNYYEFLLSCPAYCDHSRNHRDVRKPLISLDDPLETDPAVVAPPGGGSTAPPAVVAPPKPSLNQTTQLKKETHVIARETKHIYAETGWCLTCVHPAHRLEEVA
jgi:hypothetical protein